MPDPVTASPEQTAPALTEVQRVVDTFTAPSKTFTDIRRNATFWGPLVILILVAIGFSYAVQQKVGWEKVFENNLHQSPSREEQFQKLPPEQQATQKVVAAKFTGIVAYCYPVIILLFTAIFALLVWVTVNFGFAGSSKYGQVFAVNMYANLVMNLKYLLAIVALFAGVAPESFLLQNPVGTNIGYYLSTDAPKWLAALCQHIDLFEIWSVLLTSIGVSIVAKVSRGKAAAAVVGWWLIFVLVGVGFAAAS
ncbi:MAG: YIP1 family protein [Silvibacterium sp.]|nr:YIP1 family protein [Silvibacterium sp.]